MNETFNLPSPSCVNWPWTTHSMLIMRVPSLYVKPKLFSLSENKTREKKIKTVVAFVPAYIFNMAGKMEEKYINQRLLDALI